MVYEIKLDDGSIAKISQSIKHAEAFSDFYVKYFSNLDNPEKCTLLIKNWQTKIE
jgi:hypothetical protein